MKPSLLALTTLALAAAGCGSVSGGGSGATADNPAKAPKESVTANQSGSAKNALLVTGAIPACSSDNLDQLIYVVQKSEFQSCNGSSWVTIAINGKDGANGNSGKDGANGTNGTDGAVYNGNTWYDVVDKKYWLVPTQNLTASTTYITGVCGGSNSAYRMPTCAELHLAKNRGLSTAADAVGAPNEAFALQSNSASDTGIMGPCGNWLDAGSSNYLSEQYIRTTHTLDNSAGYYCVQK